MKFCLILFNDNKGGMIDRAIELNKEVNSIQYLYILNTNKNYHNKNIKTFICSNSKISYLVKVLIILFGLIFELIFL